MKRTLRIATALAFVASSSLIGGASSGTAGPACQPVTAYNSPSLEYVRCEIPDLDQRRNPDPPFTPGLPNGGLMYCVPTSALDFMAYLANQGFPTVAPGPGDWGPEPGFPPYAHYNTMTTAIQLMGGFMGTDPLDGTGDGSPAMKTWLAGAGVGDQFTVSAFFASGSYSPTFWDLGVAAVNGGLVMPIVGWYKGAEDLPEEIRKELEDSGQDPAGLWRAGGHVVAMALARSSDNVIGLRDPASPNNGVLVDQASFSTDEYDTDDTLATFDGTLRTQTRIVDYGSVGYLDGYFEIRPKYGMVSDKTTISFLRPIQLIGVDVPEEERIKSFTTPTGADVTDVALRPGHGTHAYLLEGDNTIWQIDERSGRSSRFATVGNPERLAFSGRDQRLYVLLPNHVIALDQHGRQVARTHAPVQLSDIAFDELRGQLAGVSEDGSSLVMFEPDGEEVAVYHLENSFPEKRCLDGLSVHSDPASGALWLMCEHLAHVLRVVLGPGRTAETTLVELQGAVRPTGLSIDDDGHLFVADHGSLVEYDAAGRQVTASPFRGLPGGTSLDLSRSVSNFDPERMSGPRYRNVLPDDSGR